MDLATTCSRPDNHAQVPHFKRDALHFSLEAAFMRPTALFLSLALLGSSAALIAQSPIDSTSLIASDPTSEGTGAQAHAAAKALPATIKPLSRFALGAGVSAEGIDLQAATNLDRHFNLRVIGNVFQHDINDISSNGFNIDAKLNLASGGASLDFYPFPNHGFRLSPGVLAYNQNAATATFAVTGGTSFTLDDVTYYASTTNPVKGTGSLGLHANRPAFTITTGWGNMIPRKGGHFSFPFELGVAFIGEPAINIALNSGQVCDANGQNCVDVATDQDVQNNLQAQIAKYKSDLDPLKTYPIVSFGVAYSFRIR
jgi:hypothetical protein